MIPMTTARCPLGVSPRRHCGACVVAQSGPARIPGASPALTRSVRSDEARLKRAGCSTFNADRLTACGLKDETAPACHTPHKGPRGFAHRACQGVAAQPGGRRPFPSPRLAGHRSMNTGCARGSYFTPSVQACSSGFRLAVAGLFSLSVHGSQSLACAWERSGTISPKESL